jgi:hypothetical protein
MPEGLKNFYKRWNIPLNENEMWTTFKNRTMNSITSELGRDFCLSRDFRNEYLNLIDQPIEHGDVSYPSTGLIAFFYNTPVCHALNNEGRTLNYIYYMEKLFQMTKINQQIKDNLFKEFEDIIKDSGVSISLTKGLHGVVFYPAGAKLLDDKLINDNIQWLQDYPEVYKQFEGALQLYQKGGKLDRSLLDNLRFSLEQLLKAVLNNNAPLEKQSNHLGTFLDGKGINTEIRNMYVTLIGYFAKYQNENVKHEAGYNPKEVEFIIYLTGSFMRLLLQVK